MLSQSLDEMDKINLISDMDNYLDGFCFKLDKSVLPAAIDKPKVVKIKIAPEQMNIKPMEKSNEPLYTTQNRHTDNPNATSQMKETLNDNFLESVNDTNYFSENATDYNDLDFYQMQFFQ